MVTVLEDDWENAEIPDLVLNLQVSIKNKERELKLLKERQLMEEADITLAEELIYGKHEIINKFKTDDHFIPINLVKKEKPTELLALKEKKRKELEDKQKQEAQKQKEKKQKQKKQKELYGEAELDEYEEKYGYIEDKY